MHGGVSVPTCDSDKVIGTGRAFLLKPILTKFASGINDAMEQKFC